MNARRRRNRTSSNRRGVEVVELALALPVLIVMVFGALESCEVVFLKQSLAVASYEGSRLAARRGSTAAEVAARCEQILTGRRVQDATVTITPSSIANVQRGTPITVDIRAPMHANNTTKIVLSQDIDITQQNTMLRE